MYHQTRRLVHRNHGGVLVEDFDWQILRRGRKWQEAGRRNFHAFSAAQQQRSFSWFALHAHMSILDPALEARAAVLRETLLQEVVEPLSGIGCSNGKQKHR